MQKSRAAQKIVRGAFAYRVGILFDTWLPPNQPECKSPTTNFYAFSDCPAPPPLDLISQIDRFMTQKILIIEFSKLIILLCITACNPISEVDSFMVQTSLKMWFPKLVDLWRNSAPKLISQVDSFMMQTFLKIGFLKLIVLQSSSTQDPISQVDRFMPRSALRLQEFEAKSTMLTSARIQDDGPKEVIINGTKLPVLIEH